MKELRYPSVQPHVDHNARVADPKDTDETADTGTLGLGLHELDLVGEGRVLVLPESHRPGVDPSQTLIGSLNGTDEEGSVDLDHRAAWLLEEHLDDDR